jgi:hypothetical protein
MTCAWGSTEPPRGGLSKVRSGIFDQTAAAAAFFRFLRQPSRPRAPRPDTKRGSAPGMGVAKDGSLTGVPGRLRNRNPGRHFSLWLFYVAAPHCRGPSLHHSDSLYVPDPTRLHLDFRTMMDSIAFDNALVTSAIPLPRAFCRLTKSMRNRHPPASISYCSRPRD